ncbi:YqaA family protein [Kangiella sediminilitoris]|uniref:SNARE associated Golgi protein n=1 Tax=Kangiella sediminilitoris TaxID=1144748 RepID=A0A1B3BBQ7_9GAMM|nr:YqaA family protein [Kangiella sediminilitoris]AOE50223.1 SNARE associated Golgi protein [Kangiella sediminilitoris]
MNIFTKLYDACLRWARHRYAVYILGFISFIESIFFPIPTAAMLAPMALAKPHHALRLALIAMVTSVLGGVAGYLIGAFAFESWVLPWIHELGYTETYLRALDWFAEYGVWVVLIAGFSPVPYKIFTLTAGALSMAFVPFFIASIIARSAQFFLISGLIKWGGEQMQHKLRQYVDWIGWGVLILGVLAYIIYNVTH